MIHTGSGFLLNPRMVALAIEPSVSSTIHSWGTLSGAGGFAELPTDICTSVWIKLLSLTGKHSKLSFIFLKKEQTEEVLFMLFFGFVSTPWPPSFYGSRLKNSQVLKPTSHTSQCCLHCSTSSPWAPLLKGVLLPQPASRLSLELLFLTSWASFRHQGQAEHPHVCSEESQGWTARVHFAEQERRHQFWWYLFRYTNLTWAYTCLSKALGFNLWFSWAWCVAKSST